jgi:hypothetical protein
MPSARLRKLHGVNNTLKRMKKEQFAEEKNGKQFSEVKHLFQHIIANAKRMRQPLTSTT